MGEFARTSDGRENWGGLQSVPRHRHAKAYCALVLSGGYEECGSCGRFRVGLGDVLLHGAYDAHPNHFPKNGARLLNLVMQGPAFGTGRDNDVRLADWAAVHGLAPETVSRGFAKVFAVTPVAFRREAMTRKAYALLETGASLARVASDSGFADQAHLSRAMVAMTGFPPGALRKSIPFKTAAGAAA